MNRISKKRLNGTEKFHFQNFAMPESASHGEQYVQLPATNLTESIKKLQDMFPGLNTAIIDRAIITSNGDVPLAVEKLLQINNKFS